MHKPGKVLIFQSLILIQLIFLLKYIMIEIKKKLEKLSIITLIRKNIL